MLTHLSLELKQGETTILEEKNIPANINNNEISFKIEEMSHIIDTEKEIFKRENDDYLFFIDLKNKNSSITLKKEEYILQVEVEYAILLKNQNEIKISYLIETDDQTYNLRILLEEGREK